MSTEAKVRLCSACGEDCSGQPRIKDKKGRYLHKTCADRVRAKQKAAKKPKDDINTPIHPASTVAASASMADFYGDALKEVAQTCPSCNNSMKEGTSLCVQCGYNFESGKSLKTTALVEKAPKDKSGAPADNSAYIGFGVFAVLMGLGAGGSFKPELYIPLLLTSVLISLPLWLWITVEAFKQTVGPGPADAVSSVLCAVLAQHALRQANGESRRCGVVRIAGSVASARGDGCASRS